VSDYNRREFLTILGAAPLIAALPKALVPPLPPAIERAAWAAQNAIEAGSYDAAFFTAEEWETVRVLADTIIPADREAGGAIDAGVPEFIDFTVDDRPALRVPIRGGLRWLDAECRLRFDQPFVGCSPMQREELLDLIAWPDRSPPELSQGAAFFSRFRDLVAMGYFTSRIGLDYLGYAGNTYVPEWNGCPPEALDNIGVSYDD
jgi:gluconate 2-dehydrogenase gamma chain